MNNILIVSVEKRGKVSQYLLRFVQIKAVLTSHLTGMTGLRAVNLTREEDA